MSSRCMFASGSPHSRGPALEIYTTTRIEPDVNLELSDDQKLLRDTFAQLFAAESSAARVHAAESTGFDPKLWKQLAEVGALGMRVPSERGGGGASLLDACVVAAEAGRRLVTGPLLEAIAAARALSECAGAAAEPWLERLLEGSAVVSLWFGDPDEARLVVPHGAVADAALALAGGELVLLAPTAQQRGTRLRALGSGALAEWSSDISR